jgi:hypothetical protein
MMDQYGNEEEWVDIVKDIISSNSNNSPLYSSQQTSGYSFDLIDNMTSRNFVQTTTESTTGGSTGSTGSTGGSTGSTGAQGVGPTPPVTWNPTGGGEQFLRAGSGSTSTRKPAVKIATPQYVTFKNDEINAEDADFLKMIYFEEINGAMLLSLTNNAKLSTESVNYQPIINMAEIQKALDPKNILALQDTSDKYFLNFAIKLDAKVPNVGNGPSGKNVYIDTSTGNLVIESIDLNPGEKIEIETLQNGTIYETDLGVDQE